MPTSPLPLQILLVEDDPYIRATVAYILTAVLTGPKISQAVDGMDGLRQCREQPFDWIVTDLRMPGLSGLDMLLQMRAEGVRAPAIIASGSPLPRVDLTHIQPFFYVPKPDLSPIPRIILEQQKKSGTSPSAGSNAGNDARGPNSLLYSPKMNYPSAPPPPLQVLDGERKVPDAR